MTNSDPYVLVYIYVSPVQGRKFHIIIGGVSFGMALKIQSNVLLKNENKIKHSLLCSQIDNLQNLN